MVTYILAALCGIFVIGADQYTKYFISANYALAESHGFIPGIIDITYVRNTGAAWGMLSDRTWLLISITAVVMLVCFALILKYGTKNKFLFWAMILVLSGGVGNMIDRIFHGFVVDFLHFTFWPEFPVFNLADCAIVSGAVLLAVYFVISLYGEQKEKNRKKGETPQSQNKK